MLPDITTSDVAMPPDVTTFNIATPPDVAAPTVIAARKRLHHGTPVFSGGPGACLFIGVVRCAPQRPSRGQSEHAQWSHCN